MSYRCPLRHILWCTSAHADSAPGMGAICQAAADALFSGGTMASRVPRIDSGRRVQHLPRHGQPHQLSLE